MKLQGMVDEFVRGSGGYWEPFEMFAALVEEVGELGRALLSKEGVKGSPEASNLGEEMGDVLFALACLANYYGVDLEKALASTVEKYRSREI
ncbi:MazG nucleotide pyrophosphohydrolase domain-containing protein [Thermococcus sp.]|uniref:MazG nucleotide pyrophosphohydrolase domain-containing protein n=1 Tax=Thermococcus sp. TaxID=35749 RepID=UPI00260D11DC|nr:MazG nucleotide pyrophosphohydrolase domain-containing protein [Thermococcus sp.]